ncbi:MAG: 2-oxo-4-hydroxy-4-carboxy-5-ureidoimidazoline decarboxylase [Pseudomonadales bacterium]|nr:2-oxo-4-hydroxy-4-carboxy-5-ureidoimidazoline decarboxylase [Pseudomonadales bacterium]MBO7007433.1 2-oxo-4-hydroxy-4-carboxy-5-ureidoimidazoline decarboxylase [Pseudomonadales bacterium]
MTLEEFNDLGRQWQYEALLNCCSCEAWAARVPDGAPFESVDAVVESARNAWDKASENEVLEAFSGHPQIGDLEALRNQYANTASAEQGQVVEADETVLIRLRDQNKAYLEKFGFIFIVCATGKSAEEMLALLDERIGNSREEELVNGAREQMAITELRIRKMVEND